MIKTYTVRPIQFSKKSIFQGFPNVLGNFDLNILLGSFKRSIGETQNNQTQLRITVEIITKFTFTCLET